MLRNQYARNSARLDTQHKDIIAHIAKTEKLKTNEVEIEEKQKKDLVMLELKEHVEVNDIYSCQDKISGINPCLESDKKISDRKPILNNIYIKKRKW